MRTIALLILALTASSVMSACAGDNFIANALGWTIAASGSEVPLDNTFTVTCGVASGADQCCDAATVNGIQDDIDTLIGTLEDAAGDRDTYIIARRGDVIDVLSSLRSMHDAIERADNDDTSLGSLAIVVTAFSGLADTVTQNFTGLVENFEEYQEARATCMETLITVQASIWCQACADDGLGAGFTETTSGTPSAGGTVAFDAATKTALAAACYDYIQFSANQSSIISLYTVRNGLADLASALTNLVDGNLEQAATDLASAVTTLGTISNPSGTYEKPVEVPSNCASASDCVWVEELLETGALANTDAILGGTETLVSIVSAGGRVLSESGSARRLQFAAETDPTALGITVAFAANPAGVDNTENANSAIRNGIVACAVAALALFF